MILVVPFKYYILPKRTHGSLSGFREFRCVIGGTASEASRAQKARTPIKSLFGVLSMFSYLLPNPHSYSAR